jgi:hypothetical protein
MSTLLTGRPLKNGRLKKSTISNKTGSHLPDCFGLSRERTASGAIPAMLLFFRKDLRQHTLVRLNSAVTT